jgi:uncharacterized membrane protein
VTVERGGSSLRHLGKTSFLFFAGGGIYYGMEWVYKTIFNGSGITHWSMAVVGGLMFLAVGAINEIFSWETPLLLQGLLAAVMITVVEFMSGLYLNLKLGLGIWDYSNLPFNLLGQICPQFFVVWFFAGIVAVILDDYLRYWLFHEERPHYRIFTERNGCKKK